MAASQEIRQLKELIQRLQAVDTDFRVFGADSHKYKLWSTLSETELQEFEHKHQIELPNDYRLFLKEIGNGKAGPSYGLRTLEEAADYCDLSKPFLLTKNSELYSDDELGAFGYTDEYPGILEICHHGCASYSYLVVSGPTYGTIWDGPEDFHPTGLSFSAWYRDWADKHLHQLLNEPLVDKIRVGMTKAEVVKLVGEDWQERQTLSGSTFFECAAFRAQLELNERGVVTKINRY